MMIRVTAGLIVLGGLAGCVESHVPPEERVFAAGRYQYRAAVVPPGMTDSVRYAGTLALDDVTPDSLVGRWEVPGYDPALRENRWNVASYEAHAIITPGGDTLTLIHHLERGRDTSALACRISVTRPGHHSDGTCTLRR